VKKIGVTDSQFLSLFELCLEAEERCARRARAALTAGDGNKAAYDAQLRDRYSLLKACLFEAMNDPTQTPLSLQQTHDQTRDIAPRPGKHPDDKKINAI
jgi:hypothetical protein